MSDAKPNSAHCTGRALKSRRNGVVSALNKARCLTSGRTLDSSWLPVLWPKDWHSHRDAACTTSSATAQVSKFVIGLVMLQRSAAKGACAMPVSSCLAVSRAKVVVKLLSSKRIAAQFEQRLQTLTYDSCNFVKSENNDFLLHVRSRK